MSNFNKTYDLILEDIIQSVSPEELKERRKQYPNIAIKTMFDKLVKENKIIKNQYGTYDVNEDIELYDLKLLSLLDIPYRLNKINGYFSCFNNRLTNLEGCPKIVNGYFICAKNKLTSLEGCPKIVNEDFVCYDNKLINLEGCPKKISGEFSCSFNNLTSLEGCPEEVYGDFNIADNSIKFKEEDIRKICKVGGDVYV